MAIYAGLLLQNLCGWSNNEARESNARESGELEEAAGGVGSSFDIPFYPRYF